MIKKVRADQLKPGVFVHDLNCGWMDHPFMRNNFKVASEEQVRIILTHGIREVYIDTSKGSDIKDGIDEAEVKAEIEKEIISIAPPDPIPEERVPLREEIARATRVHLEANQIIQNVMKDVRLGKQVELEQIEPVVEKVTASILRNQSALLGLCRIKNKDDYTFQHSVMRVRPAGILRPRQGHGPRLHPSGRNRRPTPRHRQDAGARRSAQQAGQAHRP